MAIQKSNDTNMGFNVRWSAKHCHPSLESKYNALISTGWIKFINFEGICSFSECKKQLKILGIKPSFCQIFSLHSLWLENHKVSRRGEFSLWKVDSYDKEFDWSVHTIDDEDWGITQSGWRMYLHVWLTYIGFIYILLFLLIKGV